MYTPSVIVLAAALLATATAQSSNPTVWASVALMMHGERTPLRSELSDVLTPRGAQQLYAQGNAFRTRYLSGITPTNSSESRVTSRAPIRDIAPNVVDHVQLHILSLPDAHVVAGAQAFLQALYPPISHTFAVDTGGSNVSFSTTSGNYTEYPLDGYQYPVIQTAGYLDQRSIGLRGNTECTQWQVSTQVDMTRDPDMLKMYNSTKAKYQSFFTTPPLNDGVYSLANANFWDAYNIWDYIRYRHSHEEAVYNALMNTYVNDSQFLQIYSRQQQLALYSAQKPSGLTKGDMIRTVAGMSFAKQVVDALKANGNFGGCSRKLTLLFSSQEPFLSFFSLAQLQQGNTSFSSPFWNVPEPGAAMVFELIGDEPDRPDSYPKDSNLYVRFLYRKNADPSTPFEEYALFGSPAAEPRVTFSYFKQEMLKFGVDVTTWCSMCASSQPFCSARSTEAPTIGAAIRAVVRKPYVAGIIGAAIILAVLGLVVAAFVLAGFRIRRVGKEDNKDGHQPAASLGGFKAAEKMASDPDLSLSKRGVPHERHGSWELREGRDVVTGGQHHGAGISVDKSSSASSVHSKDLDDDGASVMGASPVTPRESV
ncbi:histidine acid [Colletotrichum kahawae]|uniref:Histidine acid n=1 Tax=Colletotrichum kahawae TaxID=34407 RepID=A0AAD9Y4A6_COLKA|nr:histidine acid [Colletotrichum kahawae]